jgi:hypothetical protein
VLRHFEAKGQIEGPLQLFNPRSIDPKNVLNAMLLKHREPDPCGTSHLEDAPGLKQVNEQRNGDHGRTPAPVAMEIEELGVIERG